MKRSRSSKTLSELNGASSRSNSPNGRSVHEREIAAPNIEMFTKPLLQTEDSGQDSSTDRQLELVPQTDLESPSLKSKGTFFTKLWTGNPGKIMPEPTSPVVTVRNSEV